MDYNDGKVTFSYKDNKAAGIRKTMTLEVDEFVLRFMQHVLPSGFCKIRYFGFMAICNMKSKLSLCFELILTPTYLSRTDGLQATEVMQILTGKDPFACTKCQTGRLGIIPNTMNIKLEPG